MAFDSEHFVHWAMHTGIGYISATRMANVIRKYTAQAGEETFIHDTLYMDTRVLVDRYTPGLKNVTARPYRQAIRKYAEYLRNNNIGCDSTSSDRK